ncbi:vicilin Cor a 11.0101-like [Andrographis paniculata]|uniref:vicilin Cor a 11.0101-like n=1 Tax=Andrographis paniculata TaxID=175694 RepID=UPI0021E860C8|nr:vicilin Cor a 11.0101-like [Andrographis paniculata]
MHHKTRLCLFLTALFLASAVLISGHDSQTDPQREFERCRRKCDRRSPEARRICEDRCEERRRRQEEVEAQPGGDAGEREVEDKQNPYVYEDRHFGTDIQTRHGRVRVLRKFTEGSGWKLLRGVENYRVVIVEAEPRTFVVPNHWDADVVIFVANGKGSASLVRQNRRESFNIKEGDVFRIRAGTTTYLVNRDNNEKLVLVKLAIPVSIPGHFQAFFGAAGENPQSFYNAFSDEILEATFNTRKERLDKLFGQQKQGAFLKATEDQIRSMSRHKEGGIWPFGGESKGAVNIYEEGPKHDNKYGQLYEVDSSEYKPLRDLNVAVSLANITQGGMSAMNYNSKLTKISVVIDGEGHFEMACPHVSKESRRESQLPSYQRVGARLRRGTVVVVPAGHPFVAVASNNRNLQLLCFEVNAEDNESHLLAGKRNVMKQLEETAKELAFGVPAQEVDEVFNNQQEEYFFPGPQWRQQRQDLLADA